MPESLSHGVIQAIAAKEGVDPTELTAPLHRVVDPDALDRIFRNGTGTITFTYLDYDVTVDHSGRVEVAPVVGH